MRAALSAIVAVNLVVVLSVLAQGQATSRPADAWPLYQRAFARIEQSHALGFVCPAASLLWYADYPPFPPEWHRLENKAYDLNAPAFEAARQARDCHVARWPVGAAGEGAVVVPKYLNRCQHLSSEIADAALLMEQRGNHAEAIEYVRDDLHLAELLDHEPPAGAEVLHADVALGIRAVVLNRLEVICTGAPLTSDRDDHERLQVDVARALIRQLFTNDDPAERFKEMLDRDDERAMKLASKNAFRTTLRRGQTERNLAAMSLACHLFQFEKSRWPASMEELRAYLPAAPEDAWGVMGYALVKGGRPNGSDRPLVYSRCESRDGLWYRIDEPHFGFYHGDGSRRPAWLQKEGGQFRDVTLWAPVPMTQGETARRLE